MNTIYPFPPPDSADALRAPPLTSATPPSAEPFQAASRFQPRPRRARAPKPENAAAITALRDYLTSPQNLPDSQ